MNWVDANIFCRINRMKLATLSESFSVVHDDSSPGYGKILVDGEHASNMLRSSPCLLIEFSSGLGIQNVSCTEGNFNFLCITDEQETDLNFSSEVWRSRQPPRFLTSIGGFG